jgi:DNA-binding transcriptional LysR family regulator
MLGIMELRHLRYFVAVAEEQNVTRAAARLHVSQPPLSRQIRDLEDELGVALFEHGAKAVRLTEAGRVFLNEARAVLQRTSDAVQTVKAVANGEQGEIQVAYAPSLTVELLPRALRDFQEASPGVRVVLHDLSTQEMLRGLRDGKIHVALLVELSKQVLSGLVFEELCRYAVCIAAHPSHPLARSKRVTVEQVAKERLVAYCLADYPEYHVWLADLFATAAGANCRGTRRLHQSHCCCRSGPGCRLGSGRLQMFCWPAIESAPAHACAAAVCSWRGMAQGHAVGSRRQLRCRPPTCQVGQGLRGIIRMDSVQLRLFPAPKPLVERLGADFFRRVPDAPGVYLMADEFERLLYIGKAKSLRARLNSYRHVQPERASRKVVRLIHAVRSVVWEICACPNSALLRENELLRLHKPKFNVMNTRPEHYSFFGVRNSVDEIRLRLNKQPVALPGETLHGAFKSLGRVRAGFAALLRLLWATEHNQDSVYDFPMPLVAERCPDEFTIRLLRSDAGQVSDLLRRMLDGRDDDLIQQFERFATRTNDAALCLQRFLKADVATLKLFHQFGPARNKSLREHHVYEDEVIAQNDLDDLLVLMARASGQK